ncbi:MAG: DUF6526 family protein [Acidobacteria bacterium]|nr:DUF6526 family protein [Acidobacteriota bacterium]
MAETAQSFKHHARWLPPFHFFVLPVFLVNVVYSVILAWGDPSFGTGFGVLVALALFMVAILARTQALKAQDRVIRLEMRLRMRHVLPADMHGRINDVTADQLIGLRFAGDGELADLVRQTLDGTLTTQTSIKQAIKDWQTDHHRV